MLTNIMLYHDMGITTDELHVFNITD